MRIARIIHDIGVHAVVKALTVDRLTGPTWRGLSVWRLHDHIVQEQIRLSVDPTCQMIVFDSYGAQRCRC